MSEKRILPIMFCCTIVPISLPRPSLTMTFDLMIFAGRVSCSSTPSTLSATSSLVVRNWSTAVSAAQHFAHLRLTDLAHGADLCAVLVEDRVLVVDLDDLRLLVHDENCLVKDASYVFEHGTPRVSSRSLRKQRADLEDPHGRQSRRGEVQVDGVIVTNPKSQVRDDARIVVKQAKELKGEAKLAAGLDAFRTRSISTARSRSTSARRPAGSRPNSCGAARRSSTPSTPATAS